MATTTMTPASFQLALAECADAIDARDWGTAQGKLAKAEAINAGLDVADSASGTGVARRESLQKTQALLLAARDSIAKDTGGSRVITGRTSFNKRTGSW